MIAITKVFLATVSSVFSAAARCVLELEAVLYYEKGEIVFNQLQQGGTVLPGRKSTS
jgi:hypothetical protein